MSNVFKAFRSFTGASSPILVNYMMTSGLSSVEATTYFRVPIAFVVQATIKMIMDFLLVGARTWVFQRMSVSTKIASSP